LNNANELSDKLVELSIKKIIVVNNLFENLNAAKKHFDGYSGVHVDYANDESAAIDLLKEKRYHLALLDATNDRKLTMNLIDEFTYKGTMWSVLIESNIVDQNNVRGVGIMTMAEPNNDVVGTMKSFETWRGIMNEIVNYFYSTPNGKMYIRSLHKYNEMYDDEMFDE
jgi:hypothetical protein